MLPLDIARTAWVGASDGLGVQKDVSMEDAKPKSMLVYKLSEPDVFRCSTCLQVIGSVAGGRFNVVSRIMDLVATFQLHVTRHHTKTTDDACQNLTEAG